MPWEELLSLLSKANCTLRTIDLSGYALTEQNLRDLLAIFKKIEHYKKLFGVQYQMMKKFNYYGMK